MSTCHSPSHWLLLAPLALSLFAARPTQAKDSEKRTSTDFLLSRQLRRGASLFELAKVRGDWEKARYVTLSGVPFKRSLVANARTGDSATFTIALDKKFDRFQTWVGTRESGGRQDVNVFRVVGDGQELFKSSEISGFDAAERINISVRDVSSLQLIVEGTGAARNQGAFAEPIFVQEGEANPSSVAVGGGDAVDVVRSADGPIQVQIGGKTVDFGADAPLVRGNRVLVPMRQLFEQIGAAYQYDPATGTIAVTRNGRRLDLTVGSTAAHIDGQLVYLDVPVQTLSAATINETLKPTPATSTPATTPTDATSTTATTPTAPTASPAAPTSPTAPAASGAATPSALPDLQAPNTSALTVPPATIIKPKDTQTTVSKASDVTLSNSSPILVPLRFIAEALDLPVGVRYF